MLIKNSQTQEDYSLVVDPEILPENHLVIYNDEVNTFDFVIDSLIEICNHNRLQAEQCTLIIHYNGKCSVKDGDFTGLKPMCEALLERGLTATIE